MKTHAIRSLLKGTIDLDVELQIVANLPLILRRVEPADEHSPDFRIVAGGGVDVGYGWSRTSKASRIPYLDIVIRHKDAAVISGVAWQSPEQPGRWFAQLQHAAEARHHA